MKANIQSIKATNEVYRKISFKLCDKYCRYTGKQKKRNNHCFMLFSLNISINIAEGLSELFGQNCSLNPLCHFQLKSTKRTCWQRNSSLWKS